MRTHTVIIYRTMEDSTAWSTAKHMRVRISLPSYKVVYESGTDDLVLRSRSREEEEMLRERSWGREEERQKSRWL
jgi:paired amphipathic helix protein Sin3a